MSAKKMFPQIPSRSSLGRSRPDTKSDLARRRRPTIQDAMEYMKIGHYIVRPPPQKTFAAVEKECQQLGSTVLKHLRCLHRLELVVLKGHVLAEHAMELFISSRFERSFDFERARLSFMQKLELVHAVGLPPDPCLLPTFEILNRARNQIAHRLDFDRDIIDVILRLNLELDTDSLKDIGDRKRSRLLKRVICASCGMITGMIVGRHIAETSPPRQAKRRPRSTAKAT